MLDFENKLLVVSLFEYAIELDVKLIKINEHAKICLLKKSYNLYIANIEINTVY